MPSPFPGMDPYLEAPELWAELHNRLIVAIADDLSPKLRPNYRVAIDQRIYLTNDDRQLVGIPDVTVSISLTLPEEVRESYLEIRDIVNGQVVTVIEILSPKNKQNGEGRIAYERKRNEVLASATHFIEIDLCAFPLRSPLPSFPLPLNGGNVEPVIDLQTIFEGVYDRAGFDMVINYQKPLLMQLDATDREWVEKILIERS